MHELAPRRLPELRAEDVVPFFTWHLKKGATCYRCVYTCCRKVIIVERDAGCGKAVRNGDADGSKPRLYVKCFMLPVQLDDAS